MAIIDNGYVNCCVDGSIDAERSMVTDLANQMDPEGMVGRDLVHNWSCLFLQWNTTYVDFEIFM